MTPPKRHLQVSATQTTRRTACGLRNPARTTINPAEVTCLACRKSLHMADRELAERQSQR